MTATKTDEQADKKALTMETLVAFCRRKGYIFQASEIYGGLNGFFDYGPLGVELKNNIRANWWKTFVHDRDDMVGLDSAIIQNPKLWEASGHTTGFNDPMVDCKESKSRYRADHLLWSEVFFLDNSQSPSIEKSLGFVSFIEGEGERSNEENLLLQVKELLKKVEGFKKRKNLDLFEGESKGSLNGKTLIYFPCDTSNGTPQYSDTPQLQPYGIKPFTEATTEQIPLIPSPATGKPGSLTEARQFNMMFKTFVGALEGSTNEAFLRPETAGGIFTNFKNVVDTHRVKLPFGIAQVGKAFRNEITPRNFIYRSREFEQMEIEYFVEDGDQDWKAYHAQWVKACKEWYIGVGVAEDKISEYVYPDDDLAHYAKACTDLFFEYPFGKQELMGIAARGDFDLGAHSKATGKPLEIFDEASKRKIMPHVVEPSFGLDRAVLVVLLSAYDEDEVGGEKRVVLRLKPNVAPFKAAVLPLLKNKPELVGKAKEIYASLRKRFRVDYDETAAIGKRYRRQDEVGTPFCITVDFDTLETGEVTIRDRDTTQQVKVNVEELVAWLDSKVNA